MFCVGKFKLFMFSIFVTALLMEFNDAANTPKDPKCLLPKNVGSCSGTYFRFYFNSKSGECEKFNYSGCQGNDNNFGTKKECEKDCKKK
ncbi:kappaPI-actitoxin-Avd3c-like [Cochliomyia hominivorax]